MYEILRDIAAIYLEREEQEIENDSYFKLLPGYISTISLIRWDKQDFFNLPTNSKCSSLRNNTIEAQKKTIVGNAVEWVASVLLFQTNFYERMEDEKCFRIGTNNFKPRRR